VLALLRALAPVGAGEASAALRGADAVSTSSAPPSKSGARHFTVTNPPKGAGRFLAPATAGSQKYHPVSVGDHECEAAMKPIDSIEDCAAAAQILWPEGWGAPCTYPVWAENILITDEPHEPYGCLALRNPESHGCGLRWNPTGHEHDCVERGLTCQVVCWEEDEVQLGMGLGSSAGNTTAAGNTTTIEIEKSIGNTTGDVNITNATALEARR